MKKIVVFTGYYIPYMGGLSSHAHEFNMELVKKGYAITVFTSQLPSDASSYEKIAHDNLTIIRFPAFEIIPNYPLPKLWHPLFWRQYMSLFSKDFAFVISRIRFFNTSLLALIYAKIKRKKIVHIEHTSNYAILSSPLKTRLAKLYDDTIGRMIFASATINIAISHAVYTYIQKFDHRTTPIIYRGLDLQILQKITPDTVYKQKYADRTIIAIASRLYKWKGIEYTVHAIESLPKEIKKDVVFLIIGDGEDYAKLKEHASENIVLIGRQPRNKAVGILKIADIYVHSSMPGGGLSTSLLEAMYARCAIIATPNEGADEVIKDGINGILVSEPYSDNIKNAIIKLLKDPSLMHKLQNNAHETITKKFDWHKTIHAYEKIFAKIEK